MRIMAVTRKYIALHPSARLLSGFLTFMILLAPGMARAAWTVDLARAGAIEPDRLWLLVTLADEEGRPVTDLGPDRFRLRLDGGRPMIPVAARPLVVTDHRLVYMILLDVAEDLPTSLTTVRDSAGEFVAEMGFHYPGGVMTYTDRPKLVIGPRLDPGRVREAIFGLQPAPGPARLSEGVISGLDTLGRMAGALAPGDQVVVVLFTDGRDTPDFFGPGAAATKLFESGAVLVVLGYGLEDTLAPWMEMARRSKGRGFFSAQPDALPGLAVRAAALLKNQYRLDFASTGLAWDGGRHRLDLDVRGPEGPVRSGLDVTIPYVEPDNPPPNHYLIGLGILLLIGLLFWMNRPGKTSGANRR